MRFVAVAVLVVLAGVCLLQPVCAMPHVRQAEGNTFVVMREVEETEDVEVDVVGGQRIGESSSSSDGFLARIPEDLRGGDDEEGDEEGGGVGCGEVEFGGLTMASTAPPSPPPPRRCTLKGCWRCCQRRGYNWGLCLWKRCHCYY